MANRISDIKQKAGATTLLDTTITEDAKGRVTSRVLSSAATGVTSSYFLYDEQDRVTCETTDSQTTCPGSGTDIKNNHNQSPPFLNAGDWKRVLRPVPGSTSGLINDFNTSGTAYGTSHQVTDVNQSDGTPAFGHTSIAYDARGNRSDDVNAHDTHDRRDYTYDARRNVINVRGQYYTGTIWHFYDVGSAFDARNRRVFKSFYDETSAKTATWFFYYDLFDRLTEVRYTPDSSVTATYSLFQLIWLGDRLTMYWQTDYPSVTTSKRYVGTDETGRPIDMWSWPSSGNATRVWAISPSGWGMDTNKVGPTIYQPVLFAGQYQDSETAAYEDDHATIHRPGVALNGYRTYDPFTGGYLQMDPMANRTWSSYLYAASDPIGKNDPYGLCFFMDISCITLPDGGGGGTSGDGSGDGGGGGGTDPAGGGSGSADCGDDCAPGETIYVTSTYDIDLAGALFNGPIILGGPGGGGTTCADGDAGLICRIQRWLAIMTKPKTIVKPPPPPPQPPPTCGRFGCVGDLVCDQINDLTNIACGKGTPYQTTKSRTSECLEAKRRFDMGCFPGCCFP